MRALAIGVLSCVLAAADKPSVVTKDGFVPDKATAIAIAVAVWTPLFGKTLVDAEKPFDAELHDGVWTVTVPSSRPPQPGGFAIAEIAQKDGRVLRVWHAK
jgi:hypothetical protein